MTNLYPTIDRVDLSRGAPMGRHGWENAPTENVVHLFRVPLDAGGYDPGGAYYGTPDDLWCATDQQEFRAFTRAGSYQQASTFMQERYPWIKLESLPLSDFVAGYVTCAMFTERYETEESDENFFRDDGYGISDLTPEALKRVHKDCADFLEKAQSLIATIPSFPYEQAGMDFWYDRNGHGTGFCDRDSYKDRETALALSCIAHDFYGVSLYLNPETNKVDFE